MKLVLNVGDASPCAATAYMTRPKRHRPSFSRKGASRVVTDVETVVPCIPSNMWAMSGKKRHADAAMAAAAIANEKEKRMNIKILGTGCSNCKKMEANVRQAVHDLGIEATIEKVENIQDIMTFGVMRMPGLVVNGQVKSMGRVLSAEEVKKYL